jgi:hypothetical protein
MKLEDVERHPWGDHLLENVSGLDKVIVDLKETGKTVTTSHTVPFTHPMQYDIESEGDWKQMLGNSLNDRRCLSSLTKSRAEETTIASSCMPNATTQLSAQIDVAPHWKAAKTGDDRFNDSKTDLRSIPSSRSTSQSSCIPSISSEIGDSQSGSGSVCYSTQTRREFLFRHQRQWNDLETAKSLTWDVFPWPVLKIAPSEPDILQNDVEVYLSSIYYLENMFRTMEDYVRDNMRRWDINRMEAKVFGRVHNKDLEKVERSVIKVGGILQNILGAILVVK